MKDDVRADLSDGFERIRRASLERYAQSVSQEIGLPDLPAVKRVALDAIEKQLAGDIDAFSRRQFAAAAIAVTEYVDADVPQIRRSCRASYQALNGALRLRAPVSSAKDARPSKRFWGIMRCPAFSAQQSARERVCLEQHTRQRCLHLGNRVTHATCPQHAVAIAVGRRRDEQSAQYVAPLTRLRQDVKLRLHLCDPFELHLERRAQTSELRFNAGINLLTFRHRTLASGASVLLSGICPVCAFEQPGEARILAQPGRRAATRVAPASVSAPQTRPSTGFRISAIERRGAPLD